jgi:CobQ-like glutamine amidotransferase family enzyme
VGELSVQVGDNLLVGFENHGGNTSLANNVEPLGRVVHGRGNDGVVDGYRTASIWATYAHGPVLALNPWFADVILEDVLGYELDPLHGVADRLYAERCESLKRRGRVVPRRFDRHSPHDQA